MITLILGEVPWLQTEALNRLKQQWVHNDVRVFFGPEACAAEILEACDNLSLFGEASVAVIRHAEGLRKAEQDKLVAALGGISSDVQLVFVADKIDKRLKLWQTLTKRGEVISAEPPPQKMRRDWFVKEAKRRQRRFDRDAFEQLMEVAQVDFTQALLLLDKLGLYLDADKAVSAEAVAACRVGGDVGQIFAWSEAVGAGEWQRSFAILQKLWSQYEEPLALLALLNRHFRILLKAREQISQRGNRGEMARILGVPPFAVDRYCQQARRYSRAQLLTIWQELLQTDRELKSSPVRRELVLEDLVWRLKQKSDLTQRAV